MNVRACTHARTHTRVCVHTHTHNTTTTTSFVLVSVVNVLSDLNLFLRLTTFAFLLVFLSSRRVKNM